MIAVAGCQLAYFNAVARMPVGVALLIEYAAPVAIVGWLWLTRGQRPGTRTVAGAVLAVVGLVLVLDLVGGTPVDVVGVIWAFGAMLGVATYFLLSARQDDGLPPTVLAAAGLLLGGITLLLAGATGALTFTATTTAGAPSATCTVAWWVPCSAWAWSPPRSPTARGIAATRRLGSRLASFVGLIRGARRARLRLGAARRGPAARPADGGRAGAGGRGGGQVGRARLTSADVRAGQLRSGPEPAARRDGDERLLGAQLQLLHRPGVAVGIGETEEGAAVLVAEAT